MTSISTNIQRKEEVFYRSHQVISTKDSVSAVFKKNICFLAVTIPIGVGIAVGIFFLTHSYALSIVVGLVAIVVKTALISVIYSVCKKKKASTDLNNDVTAISINLEKSESLESIENENYQATVPSEKDGEKKSLESYPYDNKVHEEYLSKFTDPKEATIIRQLLDNIQHIDFELFQGKLIKQIENFNKLIQNKDLEVSLIVKEGTSAWVAKISKEFLQVNPKLINGMSEIVVSQNLETFLFFDDSIVDSSELEGLLLHLDGQLKKVQKTADIYIIIPLMSERAYYQLTCLKLENLKIIVDSEYFIIRTLSSIFYQNSDDLKVLNGSSNDTSQPKSFLSPLLYFKDNVMEGNKVLPKSVHYMDWRVPKENIFKIEGSDPSILIPSKQYAKALNPISFKIIPDVPSLISND